jgi:hypothetical protein
MARPPGLVLARFLPFRRTCDLHRLARAARAQIDRAQPLRYRRVAGIKLGGAAEEADGRFQILNPERGLTRLNQRITITRGLGQCHQRAVEALDFGRGQRLDHRLGNRVLRCRRRHGQRQAGGCGKRSDD